MNITFPSFVKNYNTYTAFYSEDVCIDVYISTDKKMAILTLIEFKTLNAGDRFSDTKPTCEADFLAAYKQAQDLITNALCANHSIKQLA